MLVLYHVIVTNQYSDRRECEQSEYDYKLYYITTIYIIYYYYSERRERESLLINHNIITIATVYCIKCKCTAISIAAVTILLSILHYIVISTRIQYYKRKEQGRNNMAQIMIYDN